MNKDQIESTLSAIVYLQHEVIGYPGCSKCKKKFYPYYRGSDKKFYCEDCAVGLVKEGLGRFGRFTKDRKPSPDSECCKENESLRKQIATAKEALAKYRNQDNWQNTTGPEDRDLRWNIVWRPPEDGYALAESALAEIGGNDDK